MKTTQNVITVALNWGGHAASCALCRAPAAKPLQLMQETRECRKSWRSRGRRRQHARAAALPRAFVAVCFLICGAAFAQTPDNIAEHEVQRRQAAIREGAAALARRKYAMQARNYTVAYQEFKNDIGYLPDAVVSGGGHDCAAGGVC